VILVGVGDGDASLEGVRRVQTDEEGNFRAEQMPPGPYEAMAVRGMSSNDYMDPVYWEGHGAVRLTVADGKAAGVTLRFAP
jgi:protocatechuate 3,4-dioxygenase beta subunit